MHAEDLVAHLADDHGLRLRSSDEQLGGLRRWWRSLGHLPLWFVIPVDLLLVAIAIELARPAGWWMTAYSGALATFPLVLVLSARVFRAPV